MFKKKRRERYGKAYDVCIKECCKWPAMDHILLHQQNESLPLNQVIKTAFNYTLFQIICTNYLSEILSPLALNLVNILILFQVTLAIFFHDHLFSHSKYISLMLNQFLKISIYYLIFLYQLVPKGTVRNILLFSHKVFKKNEYGRNILWKQKQQAK